MTLTLVLGGQRSGKSAFAENVLADAPAKTYLATAEVFDDAMQTRVAVHQHRRDDRWTTREEPLAVAALLAQQTTPVLLDCLTLWLSNVMGAGLDAAAEIEKLATALATAPVDVVVVSNEVGLGIIPDNALARAFADQAGNMNQRIATVADKVVFVAAGLPMVLKDTTKAS